MPDEKRIKDFEPATNLLIDDWFAVDSPSQGTRKMQASMFQEGLQTQITTNTENIALHSGQISVLQQGVGNIGDKVDVLDAAITVEEYSATKLYAVDDDCVYEGVRYKCTTAIETPETFTPSHWQAISIEGELNELNSRINSFSTWKTWRPQLYDYNTYKRDFSSTNGDYKYLEIGSLVFAYINVNNQDYSGISTMLQVRNLPMETVLSGICYFAGNATCGADKVIQMVGGSNQLYPRPNMTSAYFSNPTSSGWTSIIIFGAK